MDPNDVNRISISGDLSMLGVAEQFPLLAQFLVVPAAVDQLHPHEIDLTGVQSLDACGCQLLVAFVRNLRRHGGGTCSFKLTDDCREIIHNLGFDDEFIDREDA